MAIRKIYDWALKQAEKPHATWLLFLIAVVEPCLLPLPPDALMAPMVLARRDKAFKLAAICLIGSLTGSLISYGIGSLAMATLGQWLIDTYHRQEAFDQFRQIFNDWGTLIIIAKGAIPVIPVPFFVVTLVSGVVHYNLVWFLASVLIGRGVRFFAIAGLLYFFGEPIRVFIEKYLSWIALAIMIGVALWFAAVLY